MNVEIGTETPIFLFWEYFFLNLGILLCSAFREFIIHYFICIITNLNLMEILFVTYPMKRIYTTFITNK
jgi:hypothetical protein